jgi:integrase
MARATRSAALESRNARLKLKPRKKPYFVVIAPGVGLGYRRNAGTGTWSVRASDGHGGNWLKSFGLADDHEDANGASVLTFWQAQDKARALARAGDGNNGDRPASVGEAIDAYAADLAARGARLDNAASLRFNVPPAMLGKAVALLTEKELRGWRNGLVKRGLKPASSDRVARVLKACLNLCASDDPRIVNTNAWKNGLKRMPDAESARNIILDDATVRAVIAACHAVGDDGFGTFIEALAATGARESQLLRLDVTDVLDDATAPRLLLPCSRKGRNRRVERRPIAISPRLAQVLRQAAAGRTGRLFDRVLHIAARFREATQHLRLDPDATPYCLRHSSIVRMLLGGVPTRVVAAHHDTSVPMLERHYSRYVIGDPSDLLTRKTLLDVGAPPTGNVVPISGR